MFKWFKNLFSRKVDLDAGTVASVINTIEEKVVEEAPKPKKATAPKTKKATKKTVDLSAMTKTQLLALAKERGVKANASLNKAELLKRLG
jgi:hypothetical protein